MTNRLLRLREYDCVRIGSDWAPERVPPTMPAAIASKLDRLQRVLHMDALEVGRHEARAKNYVGIMMVDGYTIEILPKIDSLSDMAVRSRLVEMLSVAGLTPVQEASVADMDVSSASLLDHFMSLYVRHLRTEWRRGRIMGYRREAANLTALKGKLLIPQNLRHNIIHPERFFTSTDRFTADVAPSRLLKTALRIVVDAAQRDRLRRDAAALCSEFEDVVDMPRQSCLAEPVHLTRQHSRFEPVLQLARLILGAQSPDSAGANRTYALLFDMNRVFEGYVAELLRRHACPPLGLRAEPQLSGRWLLRRDTGRDCFALRPDIGIVAGRKLALLIDTKWKRLDPAKPYDGVRQSDIYQAYAYGKEFGVGSILLYPTENATDLSFRRYLGSASDTSIRIGTIAVASSKAEACRRLREELIQLLGPQAQAGSVFAGARNRTEVGETST